MGRRWRRFEKERTDPLYDAKKEGRIIYAPVYLYLP
jgi:hypothetical protein